MGVDGSGLQCMQWKQWMQWLPLLQLTQDWGGRIQGSPGSVRCMIEHDEGMMDGL